MSMDRSIHLNLSVPDSGPRSTDAGARHADQPPMQQADEQDQRRFESVLAGAGAEEAALAAPTDAATPVLSGPFALLACTSPTPQACPAQPAPDWVNRMGDSIARLLVDDGRNGSRQVRMAIKDEVLAGVSVAIGEHEGRLQVDFICSNEDSRLRLNALAPEQARTLAQRLQRDVLLRVQTDDEEDPCLLETLACS